MGIFAFLAPLLKSVVAKQVIANTAGALVSSALANKAQNKQNAYNAAAAAAEREQALGDQADQFVRLREAAEAGGFNPLTVLRSAPNSGMPVHTSIPAALASTSALGTAFAEGVKTWFNAPQIKADAERDMLERRIMREELNALQKANAMPKGFGYEIPQSNNYTGVDRAGYGNQGSGSPNLVVSRSGSVVGDAGGVIYEQTVLPSGDTANVPSSQLPEWDQMAIAGLYSAIDWWRGLTQKRRQPPPRNPTYPVIPFDDLTASPLSSGRKPAYSGWMGDYFQ